MREPGIYVFGPNLESSSGRKCRDNLPTGNLASSILRSILEMDRVITPRFSMAPDIRSHLHFEEYGLSCRRASSAAIKALRRILLRDDR